MAYASEAELRVLFLNMRESTTLRTTLAKICHPQDPTPIITGKRYEAGIANDTVKKIYIK